MLPSLNSSRVPEHLDMKEGRGERKRDEEKGEERRRKEKKRGREGTGEKK